MAEEWGGDDDLREGVGQDQGGIEKLLEMLAPAGRGAGAKANPNKPAKGAVVEARLDRGRGAISRSSCRKAPCASATWSSRARLREDPRHAGRQGPEVTEAGPSTPVEIWAWTASPRPARCSTSSPTRSPRSRWSSTGAKRAARRRWRRPPPRLAGEHHGPIRSGAVKEVKIILKADVQGSVEAWRTRSQRRPARWAST